jgi:four helix bundle protein
MLNLNHKKMRAWQISILIIKEVQILCAKLPSDQKYILIDQIKRAALSVSNNIAEGASRRTEPDRKRFYIIARSSLVEVDNCLEVAISIQVIKTEAIQTIEKYILECFKLLSTMIKN